MTNVEADHLDIYRDLEDIRATFSRFARGAAAIVLCDDDAGARSIDLPASAEVIRYGIKSRDARLVASDVRSIGQATTFAVSYDGDSFGDVALRVPGLHNVQNALAAIGAGLVPRRSRSTRCVRDCSSSAESTAVSSAFAMSPA